MADQQNSGSARAHENRSHQPLRENARLSQPATQTLYEELIGADQIAAAYG